MDDYTRLIEFARTDRQRQVITLLGGGMSQRQAAKELKVTRGSIQSALYFIRLNATRRLYSPDEGLEHPVPDGFTGDFTIQRDSDGKTERSWIKGRADKQEKERLFVSFVEGLGAAIKPAKPKKPPKVSTDKLASAIIFGDAHLGMLSHAIETLAEDYDLKKGIEDITNAVDYLVDCAVPSKHGWIINVGDWTHANDLSGVTPGGKNHLDVSARQPIVARASGALLRYAVDKMLTKFEEVTVVNARGNHDEDAAFALNMYLEAVYEKEPRVTIPDNTSKFQFLEFGNNLVGVNHGDKINAGKLAGVMTRMQAEAWGRTKFKRWWTGHIHHKQMFEHESGVTIESFHTLAPVDAWHSFSGYGAERRVTMLTLHEEFGEVNRMSPSLQLIRAGKFNL